MLLYVCFQGFLCYTSSPCDTAAGHINDEQFVDVRVYWGSRAEYCFIPEVFCPSAPSSVKLSFLPQSLFQFPSKVSSFFFFFAPAHKGVYLFHVMAKITSAIVQLCGLLRQPGVSMETRFRGQCIADVLCQDVKML